MCSPIEQQVLDCFKSLIFAAESVVGVGNVDAGDSEGDDSTHLNAPILDLSLTLAQLGGDSLAATRLSFLLQESFSVSISASELLSVCLGDIFKQVRVKKGLPASLPSTGGTCMCASNLVPLSGMGLSIVRFKNVFKLENSISE